MGIKHLVLCALGCALVTACGVNYGSADWLGRGEPDGIHVGGTSPLDIYESLEAIERKLQGRKRAEFRQAVSTLKLVVTDRTSSSAVTSAYSEITPQFVGMVRNRSAEEIIQIATIYRASAPPDRY